MKKGFLLAAPLLAIALTVPLIAALVVTMDTNAAACHTNGPVSTTAAAITRAAPIPASDATHDVVDRLRRLRFAEGHRTLTVEQAHNALTIAQVARDLGVPRRGLQIAIATAIQESKLINLTGGDADSGGLFQQRPSVGWGTRAQVTSPVLASRAFFGRAQHTANPGLLDIPGWENLSLPQAAAEVQRPRADLRAAYGTWEAVAGDIGDILGGDLPEGLPSDNVGDPTQCDTGDVAAITIGTLNLLGAGHTSGPGRQRGFLGWAARLPAAMSTLENAGVSIAALQEVHRPQGRALAERYALRWGMYPADGRTQNVVIWDRNTWRATNQKLVKIPYFGGRETPMPLVQLTSTTTSQSIWVWSIHNPADVHGRALRYRTEALHRELDTMRRLTSSGAPAVLMGDFNDGHDGRGASQCVLTPTLANAFGGSAKPCRRPKGEAPIDHIYGANLTWASARVDHSTQRRKVSDHPLVVATTAARSTSCTTRPGTYHLGAVKPELARLVEVLAPMFDITTVGGYRASARDPGGHPSGLAADFMVGLSAAGKHQGDALATYARAHAAELGIDYLIWQQRIWSAGRAGEGWRPIVDRGSATENHRDHVHINIKPGATVGASVRPGATTIGCDDIVAPLPANLLDTDNHNWHDSGSHWGSWHTGTDFSVPCGTPVYAVSAGMVEVDSTQSWAGRWLVKIHTGPGSLTTWYAHMRKVTVSRGAKVRAGQQIGEVGALGNATGCHLHFEVHEKDGSLYGTDNVDPSLWLHHHLAERARSEQTA